MVICKEINKMGTCDSNPARPFNYKIYSSISPNSFAFGLYILAFGYPPFKVILLTATMSARQLNKKGKTQQIQA